MTKLLKSNKMKKVLKWGCLVFIVTFAIGLFSFLFYLTDEDFVEQLQSGIEQVKTESEKNDNKTPELIFANNFIKPTKAQLETIASGFKGNIIIEESCVIKSKDFDNVYFIAIKLSRKYKTLNTTKDIGVGVWGLGGQGGSCYSANDVAEENSLFPGGTVSMIDDGALKVLSCVNKKK